jgi:peroxiredoxin Q/BCP
MEKLQSCQNCAAKRAWSCTSTQRTLLPAVPDYIKFGDAGIEIVGISPDDEKSHQKFRDKMGMPYPLVADTDNEVSKKYGVYGLKSFMGREYMGVNRSTFLVDRQGKIVKIFKKVKPAGHSQEVLDALRG